MKIFQTENQLKNYTNELLESLIKEYVFSSFISDTWDTDLANMQLKQIYSDSEIYKKLMKSWLQDNNTEMYSVHN